MKTKNTKFHFVSGALLFIIMFGIATLVSALAPGPGIPETSIKSCVTKIFEYDREPVFEDVPIQQWYTHAANFLILLDSSFGAEGGENDAPSLPKFHPDEKITRGDFLDMLKKYQDVLDKKLPKLRSQKPKAKLRQQEVAIVLSRALGIPKKEVLEEFRRQGIKSKWVLRKEAAYVLFKNVEKVLFQLPEKILCDKRAIEDPEGFEETFGEKDLPLVMNTPPDDLPVDIELPLVPSPVPAAPDTNQTSINFALVSPRAGETVKATVLLVNAQNEPMSGVHDLHLILSAGWDFEKRYELKEFETGKYAADITSEWAGTYSVSVYQNTAPVGSPRDLTFAPALPAEVKLILVTPQVKSASKKEAVVSATLQDKFGNTIDADLRDFRISTDNIGSVKKTEKSGNETLITVEANTWGEANLTVSHLNRGAVQDAVGKLKIPFSPLVIDIPKGLEPGKSVSFPAYLFLPKDKGEIAGYKFTFNYEKEDLLFQNATDLDPSDGFHAPKVTVGDGTIRVEQTTRTVPVEGILAIGSLNFTTTANIGSGTIYAPTGVVINDQEKIINLDPSSGWGDDFFRWWYAVKEVKDVCLDVWLVEGAATRTEAMADVNEASNVFNGAAALSHCPFWLNWTINFHSISAADWTAKIDVGTGTPNLLDPAEETNLKNNFSGNAQCVQIWYVPDIAPRGGKNILGLSYPNNGGLAINNRRDRDNLTLGHELAHQLSGNAVKDQPDDDGNAQGARDAGNIMNYDRTGRNMTKTQCELIKQKPYIK